MTPGPSLPSPSSATSDPLALAFVAYLDFFRDAARRKCSGLDEQALSTSIVPSGWTLARARRAPRAHGASLVRVGIPRRGRAQSNAATATPTARGSPIGRSTCCSTLSTKAGVVLDSIIETHELTEHGQGRRAVRRRRRPANAPGDRPARQPGVRATPRTRRHRPRAARRTRGRRLAVTTRGRA